MLSPLLCCCFCWCRFWDEAFERGRSRGLCSPRTPGTRVIDPGPISRSVYRIAQTMSACCLRNERSRGLLGRVIDPGPIPRSVYRITQAMSAYCLGNDGGLCSPQTPGSRGIPPAPILRRGKRFLPNFFSHVGWGTKENAHTTGRTTGAMKTKKKPGEKACFLLRPFSIVFPGCKSIRPAVFHTAQPVGGSAASQFAKHNLPLGKHVCVFLCITGTLPAECGLRNPAWFPTLHRKTV